MSKNIEVESVALVECPQCHATPGKLCYYQGKPTCWLNGRMYVHPDRKKAAQAYKRAHPPFQTTGRSS